jgi:hypothetical protein
MPESVTGRRPIEEHVLTPESAEAREWHRIVRASVRECCETWRLQTQAGPATVEALEAIVARAAVPILRQLEERPPELVVTLLPSLVRTMLGVPGTDGRVASGLTPSVTRCILMSRRIHRMTRPTAKRQTTKPGPDEPRTTMNVRGIKVSVVRAIRAAAMAHGLTIAAYLETLMPEIGRDLRSAAR